MNKPFQIFNRMRSENLITFQPKLAETDNAPILCHFISISSYFLINDSFKISLKISSHFKQLSFSLVLAIARPKNAEGLNPRLFSKQTTVEFP